jgi:hypothetical protein
MLHETVRQLYSEEPQRTLYHYTSLTGLKGIVEQRNFWVSDIRYLNDSEELRHLAKWLNDTAGRLEQSLGPKKVLTQFREWLRHRLLIDFGPTLFVGSFTERGNLLSQWRGYCQHGRGLSIGFSPSKIIEYTRRHSFVIGRCIYDSQTKSCLAEQVINEIITAAERNGESSEFHPSQSYYGTFAETEPELLRIAALVKDDGFHEEKEWRVVSPVFSNYIEPPIKFREGSSMLIPYMEVPLADSSQKIQIEDIFVGPTPTMSLSMTSLRQYLDRSAICARIVSCGIPYRGSSA